MTFRPAPAPAPARPEAAAARRALAVEWVEARGARIRYHSSGDPESPPVVLLHGIGRSLEDWLPQHPHLSPTHRVINIDLPGFGLSQRVAEPATLTSMATTIWAVLDALGEKRPAHLMGNSLGGAVSMRMLTLDPARVRTLTLVSSAGFGKEVSYALRMLGVPLLGRRLLGRIDPRTARRIEHTLFHDRDHVTDERVDMAVRLARQPDFIRFYLEMAKSLGGLRGVATPWRTDLLTEVSRHPRPTLLVWGERDTVLPATHLAAAQAALPHATSHLFPATGHMPQLERPTEFADLVRPLLSDGVA